MRTIFFYALLASIPSYCSAKEPEPHDYAEENAVFSQALQIEMKALEKQTGFTFNKGSKAKARFGALQPGNLHQQATAQYFYEDQSIRFHYSLIREVREYYKKPLHLISPKVLAKDPYLRHVFRHESGHLLMDQVSQRNGLGICYTVEYFDSLSKSEQLGLLILTEGVAEYFGHAGHQPEKKFSADMFPAYVEHPSHEMVYDGGYWLVKDILDKYKERGLVWILKHPLVIKDGKLRQATIEYRAKALKGLKKKSPCQRLRGRFTLFFIYKAMGASYNFGI